MAPALRRRENASIIRPQAICIMLEQKIARYCKEYCPSAVAMDGWVPSHSRRQRDTNKNCGRKCSGSSERVGAFRWVRPKSEQGVPSLEGEHSHEARLAVCGTQSIQKAGFPRQRRACFWHMHTKKIQHFAEAAFWPARFCAVQVFWPKAKTLAQGNFISPEHVKSLSVSIKITTPDGVVIFMEHRNTIDTSFQTCI